MAIDESSGAVYVVDRGNNRVAVFGSDGSFHRAFGWGVENGGEEPQVCTGATGCLKGKAGAGAGQLSNPFHIAVDNSGGPSDGDVYVGTDNFRVQKFDSAGNFLRMWGWDVVASGPNDDSVPPLDQFEICVGGVDVCKAGVSGGGDGQLNRDDLPLAVGPGGTVYVGDSQQEPSGEFNSRVARFEPDGAFVGSAVVPEPKKRMTALAVDAAGDFYALFDGAGGGVRRYQWGEPSATPLPTLDPGISSAALAVDGAGNLFAVQADGGFDVITKYSAGGAKLSRFGYGELEFNPVGLAPRTAVSEVFASEEFVGSNVPGVGNQVRHVLPPPPGPVVAPGSVIASPVRSARATLNAEVNPEGGETTFRFEYVEEATYLKDIDELGPGHGFDHAKSTAGSPVDPEGDPEEFLLHPAAAAIGCPNPLTELGEGKCLNPETRYRFRVFAESAAGNGSGPIEGEPFETKPPLEIVDTWSTGVGSEAAHLHAEINPLGIPATAHFQYVDEATYQADVEAAGEGHGFDHAREGPELNFGLGEEATTRSTFLHPLSPGTTYHYRIVADNPLIEPIAGAERIFRTFANPPPLPDPDTCPNAALRGGPSAFLPDCRAYELVSPLDKDNGDITVRFNSLNFPARLDQSAVAGERLTYSAYRAFGDVVGSPFTSQYIASRDAGAEEWTSHSISPPRGINVLALGGTLESEFRAFSDDLCMGWPLHDTDRLHAKGAVADFANLYRRDNCGEESYEAITTVEPDVAPKVFLPDLQGVSDDGAHAVFQARAKLAEKAPGNVYNVYDSLGGKLRLVCILPNGTASKAGCSAGTANTFAIRGATVENAVSEDGSRIFWTNTASGPGTIYVRENGFAAGTECANASSPCTFAVSGSVSPEPARYWAAAEDGSKAIFTLEAGPLAGNLYVFDAEGKAPPPPIAEGVIGLLGASEDASRIYFASSKDLGGEAEPGEPNLYLYEAEEGGGGGTTSFIATLSAADATLLAPGRVSSALNVEPAKHGARVSADGSSAAFMSTARPTGFDNTDANSGKADAEVYLYDAIADGGAGALHCVSCSPSGARPEGRLVVEGQWAAAKIPPWELQTYAPRVFSEDGHRLFFESYEGLVARDTNGKQDVYQWEAPGKGDCSEQAAGFSPSAAGCVSLISSGRSPSDSEFVDASATGADAFVKTGSSLVVQDYGLIDIYDARVDGGFPPPPSEKPPCEGEACQSPPPPPPEVNPSSSTFEGPGNVKPRKRKPRCPKGKRGTASKQRCVKQKKHAGRKHRNGQRRGQR